MPPRVPALLLLALAAVLARCAAPPPAAAAAAPPAAAAAAPPRSAATLTCWTTVPVAPGQRPLASPVAYDAARYQLCVRYSVRCSADNPSCLAAEAVAGTLRTYYTAATAATCRALLSNAEALRVRGVLCCPAPGCNRPDPARDPSTLAVSDTWLSRAQRPPQRKAAVAGGTAPAGPGGTVPAGPGAAAPRAGVVAAAPRAGNASDAGADEDGGPAHAIVCVHSLPRTAGRHPAAAALVFTAPELTLCSAHEARCAAGAPGCTPDEAKAGAWVWRYSAASPASCEALEAAAARPGAGVRHVACCGAGAGCNAPDPALDPRTRVVPAASLPPQLLLVVPPRGGAGAGAGGRRALA
ncbi:hypothetical protein HT031_002594 [Scenedesmus sp. PABB004]|nr:hypothetical protein HT031_002594 [Scenedesmus sp. PABB004]